MKIKGRLEGPIPTKECFWKGEKGGETEKERGVKWRKRRFSVEEGDA